MSKISELWRSRGGANEKTAIYCSDLVPDGRYRVRITMPCSRWWRPAVAWTLNKGVDVGNWCRGGDCGNATIECEGRFQHARLRSQFQQKRDRVCRATQIPICGSTL